MNTPLAARWFNLKDQLPKTARLLAVSKGYPAEQIRELAKLGQHAFGESRLQEGLLKQQMLSDLSLQWHFIGHLQSNKVRAVVRNFQIVHSVDSVPLLKRISRIAGEEKCCPELMLQLKLRPDQNKGGLSEEELLDCWDEVKDLPFVSINGLMTIPPIKLSLKERSGMFKECRKLADRFELKNCSMGMSSDWSEAAAAGATWLRLGSAIFGSGRIPN